MLRSMFTGISGLRTHQQMMDVTGNNIANVNTTGFKSSTAVFQDALSQTLKAAGAPQNGQGGTNPAQVGLGVQLSSISTNFGQGSAQVTGRSTDLMINGDGFFVVDNGGEQMYTRAGAFSFDSEGKLVNPSGAVVQGWGAVDGAVDTNSPIGNITLPIGTLLDPKATDAASFGGNLPGDMTSTTPITTSITTYDEKGNEVVLSAKFTKVTSTNWTVAISDGTTTQNATIDFGATGGTPNVTAGGVAGKIAVKLDRPGAGTDVTVDLSKLTSFAGQNTLAPLTQNGSAIGSLTSFSISGGGELIGVFSNGMKSTLGQLAMASFSNPTGLEKSGESMYRGSVNSGEAALGVAGSGGRGQLQGGSLEMSNVDLGQEFTNLIIAQRGFQANSKVISTSDELLQELVNLKR